MKEKYLVIKDNLEKIKRLDPNFEAFGSSRWNYRLDKISESELTLFEKKNEIDLPNEFREFISELGFGAGPVYGVNPHTLLSLEKWEIEDDDDEEDYEEFKPLYDGYVVIAEYGCGIESVIIVDGDNKGEVWHYVDYSLHKLNDSYCDWYLRWTENLIKILEHGEHIGLLSGRI